MQRPVECQGGVDNFIPNESRPTRSLANKDSIIFLAFTEP